MQGFFPQQSCLSLLYWWLCISFSVDVLLFSFNASSFIDSHSLLFMFVYWAAWLKNCLLLLLSSAMAGAFITICLQVKGENGDKWANCKMMNRVFWTHKYTSMGHSSPFFGWWRWSWKKFQEINRWGLYLKGHIIAVSIYKKANVHSLYYKPQAPGIWGFHYSIHKTNDLPLTLGHRCLFCFSLLPLGISPPINAA